MDLGEIVEAFKLNIDRLVDERLWEILDLVGKELRHRKGLARIELESAPSESELSGSWPERPAK